MSVTKLKALKTGCKAFPASSEASIANWTRSTVSYNFNAQRSERSDRFTGNHFRDSLLRWLSPPDPSINHNTASKVHHIGTAQWFLQGSIFSQWKSTDPFLWIHGKRVLLLAFTTRRPLIVSCFYSGFGEKCRLVCPLTHSAFVKLTSSIQLLDHTRYLGLARHLEGIDGLFLF